MRSLHLTVRGMEPGPDGLTPVIRGVRSGGALLADQPVRRLLALFDDFGERLLKDDRTRRLEGVMFLSAWLRRRNLEKVLELNFNGNLDYLDRFVARGSDFLAAQPVGMVAMWMAGNVSTLPLFSLVPALLAKNACVAKLAAPDPMGLEHLWAVLSESEAEGLRGADVQRAAAVLYFDREQRDLHEALSAAADAKVVWGGEGAIKAIRSLPQREHCTEIVFGPKYSIGVIGKKRLEQDDAAVGALLGAFARDVAIFDQRACSSPQTVFAERNDRRSLRAIGELLSTQLAKLPPKPGVDAYTTMQILSARAEWALDGERDVIASRDGANWTVCMDRDVSLKRAVQSRTVFLTEVDSWKSMIPLLSPKVQTVGMAFGDQADALAFATAATRAGVARCVRPGLMNVHESPWDGKLFLSQLVRWVTAKP